MARYAGLCLNGNARSVKANLLLDLCRHELGLRHIEVAVKDGDTLMSSSEDSDCERAGVSKGDLLVKSSDGQDILIRYDFMQNPDHEMQQDVSSCLALIFDQMAVPQSTVHTKGNRERLRQQAGQRIE